MILQALVRHYEDLLERNSISPPGWCETDISYALYIDDAGNLTHVSSVKTEQLRSKKMVLAPQKMRVPAAVTKTSGASSNFLYESSKYILGIDRPKKTKQTEKRSIERTPKYFTACKDLHCELLKDVDSPAAQALVAFFEKWDLEIASSHPAIKPELEEIISGGKLVFRYQGKYIHEDEAIAKKWQEHYWGKGENPQSVCLVTGKRALIESIHPPIMGVQGAHPAGARLVSFNEPAFCSYGKEQNFNAPTSQYAAFAYTTALNHLIADREHTASISDTTVLFWAEGAEPAYQGIVCGAFFGKAMPYTKEELWQKVSALTKGETVTLDEAKLDPNRPFYILGISPKKARLSIRFFYQNTFGQILKNVKAHQDRLEIIRPSDDNYLTLPPWRLLQATVNMKSQDKTPKPQLAGDLLRSILTDTRYPATLLNGVVLRIRAEQTKQEKYEKEARMRVHAAILKAYYLKNEHPDVPKEVLTVALNTESTNIPYCLGRLFAIYEGIQKAANPDLNATIKDKYFNSASATPTVIFPILDNLSKKHLKKIRTTKTGLAVYYEKQVAELANKLDTSYPNTLTLPQQGSFQLGYYHQYIALYQKKEEK